jgi:hypothetical protein
VDVVIEITTHAVEAGAPAHAETHFALVVALLILTPITLYSYYQVSTLPVLTIHTQLFIQFRQI